LTTNYQRILKKTVTRAEGWKKPPEGILLLNIDASYRPERDDGCTRGVLRDTNGVLLATTHSFIEHVVDAPTAKVLAIREGLLLAQHVGCSRIMVQSDCLVVVETMKQGGFSATAGAPIYEECKMLWQDFFFNFH
jgi:hypothetical protein